MGLRDLIPFAGRPAIEPVVLTDEQSERFESVPAFDEVADTDFDEDLIDDLISSMMPETEEFVADVQFWHPNIWVYSGSDVKDSRLTVAYTIFPDELMFGVAYCSPNDQFSRPLGRELALQRLTSEDSSIQLSTSRHLTNAQAREVIEAFLNIGHLIDLPHHPQAKNGILVNT